MHCLEYLEGLKRFHLSNHSLVALWTQVKNSMSNRKWLHVADVKESMEMVGNTVTIKALFHNDPSGLSISIRPG
jgi:hypothetical protein